jgi:hypothetical protein
MSLPHSLIRLLASQGMVCGVCSALDTVTTSWQCEATHPTNAWFRQHISLLALHAEAEGVRVDSCYTLQCMPSYLAHPPDSPTLSSQATQGHPLSALGFWLMQRAGLVHDGTPGSSGGGDEAHSESLGVTLFTYPLTQHWLPLWCSCIPLMCKQCMMMNPNTATGDLLVCNARVSPSINTLGTNRASSRHTRAQLSNPLHLC